MTFPCVNVLYPELVEFSSFYLSLLIVISISLNIDIHSCVEKASTILTFFTSFFYPPPGLDLFQLLLNSESKAEGNSRTQGIGTL
jgi:hypothetical protein